MDPSWVLDTMSRTAALGPTFSTPYPKHTCILLLFFLSFSFWVHYTLPLVPLWMVVGLEGRDIWSQTPASWVAFAFSSPSLAFLLL